MLVCRGFFGLVAGLARGEVIPVDLRGVKVGSINAGKLGLTATSTRQQPHMPRAVDHDGVEARNHGGPRTSRR